MSGIDFHALLTQWGLAAAAALCLAGAVAAYLYVPLVGRTAAAGLVALAAALGAYDLGYRARGQHDRTAALTSQLAELQRQASETQRIATAATEREQMLFDAVNQQQEKIDVYEAELAKRPDAGCALTDDDLRRLRDITGDGEPPIPPKRPRDIR